MKIANLLENDFFRILSAKIVDSEPAKGSTGVRKTGEGKPISEKIGKHRLNGKKKSRKPENVRNLSKKPDPFAG